MKTYATIRGMLICNNDSGYYVEKKDYQELFDIVKRLRDEAFATGSAPYDMFEDFESFDKRMKSE